jgi:hypothetical protein
MAKIFDESHRLMRDFILPSIVTKFPMEEVRAFEKKRDEACAHWAHVLHLVKVELEDIARQPRFGMNDTWIRSMSSYQAKMHILGHSDMDFGFLVREFDQEVAEDVGQALVKKGYAFKSRYSPGTKREMLIYTKTVRGVPVEVKIRDKAMSLPVVRLHETLETLMAPLQTRLAYLKHVLQTKYEGSHPGIYTHFKYLLHHAYFKDDPDRFLFTR